MKQAKEEKKKRKNVQEEYNKKNNIIPKTIIKEIRDIVGNKEEEIESKVKYSKKDKQNMINRIEKEMMEAAKNLDFERATELRDIMFELQLEDK